MVRARAVDAIGQADPDGRHGAAGGAAIGEQLDGGRRSAVGRFSAWPDRTTTVRGKLGAP
jgi:hypothetical protein